MILAVFQNVKGSHDFQYSGDSHVLLRVQIFQIVRVFFYIFMTVRFFVFTGAFLFLLIIVVSKCCFIN